MSKISDLSRAQFFFLKDAVKAKVDALEEDLKKSLIPPHRHDPGMSAGPGVEDVAPSKVNPHGTRKSTKGELCKKCGKTHGLEKCGEMKVEKDMMNDLTGKSYNKGKDPKSVLPDDKKVKEDKAPGSGGKTVEKSKDINYMDSKGKTLGKAAPVTMAKPPAPKVGAAPKPSKPAATPAAAASPMKPAFKGELEKAGMNPAVQHGMAVASKQAAPAAAAPKAAMPSPAVHAGRAAAHGAALAGAFQPSGPVTSGLELAPKAPKPVGVGLTAPAAPQKRLGIFGRLMGKK